MNTYLSSKTNSNDGRKALFAGGMAAILASACCLLPLLLLALGISGAWISKLSILAPYQPIFIGLALVALFFAARRIWRPVAECLPGEVCAMPQVKTAYKMLFIAVAVLVILALTFPFFAPWFY